MTPFQPVQKVSIAGESSPTAKLEKKTAGLIIDFG